MSTVLSHKHCIACDGGTKPLKREEFTVYLEQIPEWVVVEEMKLQREFVFRNFATAIVFINDMAKIAEAEGHHPDFTLHDYKKVTITFTTHAIGGLSINDFVMAMKVGEIAE